MKPVTSNSHNKNDAQRGSVELVVAIGMLVATAIPVIALIISAI